MGGKPKPGPWEKTKAQQLERENQELRRQLAEKDKANQPGDDKAESMEPAAPEGDKVKDAFRDLRSWTDRAAKANKDNDNPGWMAFAESEKQRFQKLYDDLAMQRDASKPLSERAAQAERDERQAQTEVDRQQRVHEEAEVAAKAAADKATAEAQKLQEKQDRLEKAKQKRQALAKEHKDDKDTKPENLVKNVLATFQASLPTNVTLLPEGQQKLLDVTNALANLATAAHDQAAKQAQQTADDRTKALAAGASATLATAPAAGGNGTDPAKVKPPDSDAEMAEEEDNQLNFTPEQVEQMATDNVPRNKDDSDEVYQKRKQAFKAKFLTGKKQKH